MLPALSSSHSQGEADASSGGSSSISSSSYSGRGGSVSGGGRGVINSSSGGGSSSGSGSTMRDSTAIGKPVPVLGRSPQLYFSYCLLYAAPLLRSGFDFDGYSLLMLALGAVHMQVGGGTHAGWGGGVNVCRVVAVHVRQEGG